MARNGVWELREIMLRYCATGGSSRGVREFVERDLFSFAAKNPQIQCKTKIKGGHPCVFASYITGYTRERGLKNMDADKVGEVFQSLRDSLGRKTPTHNDVGIGVVEAKKISVQGVWRNTPDLRVIDSIDVRERRQRREEEFGLSKVMDEFGSAGLVLLTQKLLERRAAGHRAALDALPKVERVLPTE